MPSAYNTRLVSHIDCPGGGQVWVEGRTLYLGHMRPTSGTTIIDVADPHRPRLLARLDVPEGWHSHKVRVANDIMVVNREKFGKSVRTDVGGGILIYDVARPNSPKLIAEWMTPGGGVHRFDFDGRYAYISPTAQGYVGNIVMILDLADPAPSGRGRSLVDPGPMGSRRRGLSLARRRGAALPSSASQSANRLYVSYWHHGFFILDIADMTKPKLVSQLNTSPTFPHPTHTCLVMPQQLKGRKIMVVADEDVAKLRPAPPSFAWVFDITQETLPLPIATFQVPGLDRDGSPQPPMTGCHQPSERFTGTVLPFAWFAQGLRLVDVADPFAPKEVGHFVPDAAPGAERPSSNDVTIDDRGLIYLVDRVSGVDIIETNVLA